MRGKERIGYCLLLIFTLVAALLLRSIKLPFIDNLFAGEFIVFRLLGSLALFYALLALITGITDHATAKRFQTKHWCLKVTVVLLFMIISPFLSDYVYFTYGRLSQLLGGIFLFCSIIFLIDGAYKLNSSWVTKAEDQVSIDGKTNHFVYNFLVSLIFSLTSFVAPIYLANLYESCPKVTTILIFACVFVVFSVIASIISPDSSILAGSIVSLYLAFLGFSAMTSVPSLDCNPLYDDGKQNPTSFYLSILFAVVSVSYSCVSTSWNSAQLGSTREVMVKDVESPNMGNESESEEEKEDEGKAQPCYSYALFNITMVVSCSYAAMLLENWQFEGGKEGMNFGLGNTAFGVKCASLVATFLLFIWACFAPSLFPDRDFGIWGSS
ncbi:hypothetical protein RCL1_002167 [Eukaryota sp. TZLM3-RCL]